MHFVDEPPRLPLDGVERAAHAVRLRELVAVAPGVAVEVGDDLALEALDVLVGS
jgi:hypothetical protein